MDRHAFFKLKYIVVGTMMLLVLFVFAGCAGETTGPPGPPGQDASEAVDIATLSSEDLAALSMTGEVTSVTIASPPVVNFTVTDAAGYGVKGLGVASTSTPANLNYLNFAIAKLVPGADGSPDAWVSYMVTATDRPTRERVTANLVDNGDGSYTYTFAKDVATVPNVTYQPTLTHRLTIQVSGTIPGTTTSLENPVNVIYDFIPAGGTVTTKREITTTAACNECHGKIGTTTPHGGRIDTRYCVVCHTDQRRIGRTESTADAGGNLSGTSHYIVNGQALGNFVNMVHKIHMGSDLTLQGYNYANVLFNDIGYPQQKQNCRKCHKYDATNAPQGDNWKNKPSRLACGGCHDRISFASSVPTGFTAHTGGAQPDDSACVGCHYATKIEGYHLTDNATTNNPSVPTGAVNFTYEISTVTVGSGNEPVVTFRILADGSPVTFTICGATTTNATLLTGFTAGPSFLVAYASAQDGISAPADYNNRGKSAAQPASVSIVNVCNTTQGSMAGPDGSGYYTATVTGSAGAALFPAGSTLRAVALQGYFTQLSPAVARHTVSVVKAVTGDPVRREVVDSAKCANCHEWFEGHGGNRVYNTQVCVVCHNPNLSSSGRGADPVLINAHYAGPVGAPQPVPYTGTISQGAYDAAHVLVPALGNNPLVYPEATNNFKDMIHGIHGSHKRTTPYQFVRDRGTSGIYYYDWSHVLFPGILNNCETCHKPGTYDAELPAGALAATNRITTGAGETRAQINSARGTVPNDTDLMYSPSAATCVACHDSSLSKTHMTQNGGQLSVTRSTANANAGLETCVICHGADRYADVATVHSK